MSNKNKKNSKNTLVNNNRQMIVRPRKPDIGYTESVPAAYGMVRKGTKPVVNGTNSIRVHRREFVGTMSNGTTTGFALTPISLQTPGYDFNPACSTMFPWLSHMASCWERYKFTSLSLEFVPGQSTGTAGRFYAAVDYDYDDMVASNKLQLMGNMTSVECAVWQGCKLVCPPAALQRDLPYRYVSCTSRVFAPEPRTTYAGFLMCAFDTSVQNLVMDMWVEYDVEFVTPVNDSEMGQYMETININYIDDISIAQGTAFVGEVRPANSLVPAGPVKVIRNDLPIGLTGVLFGAAWSPTPYGLDITRANGKGNLQLETFVSVTGTSPATLLATNQLDVLWAIFDTFGYLVGYLYDTGVDSKYVIGPKVQSEVSTNSKLLKHILAFSIESLKQFYPTSAYLIPAVANSVAALGAGTNGFGFRYLD